MKKFWIGYGFGVFLLGLVVAGYFLFSGFNKEKNIILSPLPDFLTRFSNSQVDSLNLWVPGVLIANADDSKTPEVGAKSALMYEVSTGKTLYLKNPNERAAIASLTKIMTAIIALENKKDDDKYIVRKDNLVGEDSMGVTAGETYTLEELLYGLLLPSGNDAAEVLASNYEKGRSEFVKAMNDKAKALGLKNTNFTNPSGLQGDGNQYSTAHDLLMITQYAISKFPRLLTITSTYTHTIAYTSTHKYLYLQNETNLISTYPGVKGVKTGYTPEAGLCLVTYFDDGETQLIGILLGSSNRRQEMKNLLDYSLTSLGKKPQKYLGPSFD